MSQPRAAACTTALAIARASSVCGAIAVTPRSIADVGRLLAFAARTSAKGGAPLVALAMGPLGMATRVLAGR